MSNLIKFDPFKSLASWPNWMDDLDFSSQKGLKVRETDKDIVVEAVVAGIGPEEVELHIEDGVLTIKAEKSEEEESKLGYKSSSYRYYYTLALSGGQWDKAEAQVVNGVVEITIPKTEASKPRKITVKAK